MSLSEQDWREEQEYVNHVRERIEGKLDALEAKADADRSDVKEIRKHFWDEVTVNVGNSDDLVETHFAIRQQAEVLAEHERQYSHSAKVASTLARLKDTPFFGRVDFRESGTSLTEVVYIGLSSFRDDAADTFLVYDWRAPISSLYYDFSPGEVTFQAPGGTITGEMTTKRQYVIRDGHIELMFDANVTIGDELLMDALSRQSEPQMRSIVATIQQEQNQVIRDDHSRMLIVQGAAGSGKTSAALQRVAYLLYKHRGTLTAGQMVLFSPNPMFNSYVASVLPELGEENLQQTTFQEYLDHRLKHQFQVEDPFEQLEYVLTATADPDYQTRLDGIRYKSSHAFSQAIRAYVDALLDRGMRFRRIAFRGRDIVTVEEMKRHFYEYEENFRMSNRVDRMKTWLLEQVRTFEDQEMKEDWVDEEIEYLDPDDYRKAYQQLQRQGRGTGKSFTDHDEERTILARMVVHRKLAKVRKLIKKLSFIDLKGLYRYFLDHLDQYAPHPESLPTNWRDISRMTTQRMGAGELAHEDATPFLYLTELVRGMAVNTSIQHVFIDEAQDYSRLQIEFIRLLFPRSRMTLLGDINQSVYAHTPALAHASELDEVFGAEHTKRTQLSKSYRSTYEIVDFTRRMTPSGEGIVPFERHGEKPTVLQTRPDGHHGALVQAIADFQARQHSSIAVICKTADESHLVYETLHSNLPCTLVTKTTTRFSKGLVVIPAYLAKGVEFDAVILYNGSERVYGREIERQLFYTACTRAMHDLTILTAGDPSHFITDQPTHTYTFRSESAL